MFFLDGCKNLNVQGEGEHDTANGKLDDMLQLLGKLEGPDSSNKKLQQGKLLQRR